MTAAKRRDYWTDEERRAFTGMVRITVPLHEETVARLRQRAGARGISTLILAIVEAHEADELFLKKD